jgi:excisionase family DNA binding protein
MNLEFIGIKEVVRLTGISKSRLYKLTAKGQIIHYKPTGKLLFKRHEILEWVENGKVGLFTFKQHGACQINHK